MDNPAKPEAGDPTTLDGVKDVDNHEQTDFTQAPKDSLQNMEDLYRELPPLPSPSDMVPHMKSLLAIFRGSYPVIKGPGPETPSLFQFFNFTALKLKGIDYSDDDLAEYKSFTQTEGGVGGSATMTDYLIAKTFQSVVQQRYKLDFTVGQMAQIRVDLKQGKRFVGYNLYHPFFNLFHTRASRAKAGKVDANSVLDDVELIIVHSGPIDAKLLGFSDHVLSTRGSAFLFVLRKIRSCFYDVTKSDLDTIYGMEYGEKVMAEKKPTFPWKKLCEESLTKHRMNVAAQLELIEWIDMALASLP